MPTYMCRSYEHSKPWPRSKVSPELFSQVIVTYVTQHCGVYITVLSTVTLQYVQF